MNIDRKSSSWEKFWRYFRVKNLAEEILQMLTLTGVQEKDRIRRNLELLNVDEYTVELTQEINAVKAHQKIFDTPDQINSSLLSKIMQDCRILVDKSQDLANNQKRRCEQEDRELVFKEILSKMVEAGDTIPLFTSKEEVIKYLLV